MTTYGADHPIGPEPQQREKIVRLQNKIGVITAAASGMGRAGAIRFAREGAAVTVVDIDAAGVDSVVAEIRAAGGTAMAMAGDLTDTGFSEEIVAATVKEFGAMNYLWAHAGHPGPASVEDIDWDTFELAVDLNLRTIAHTTSVAIPEIRKQGGGSLLYTASTSGLRGSPHSPTYSMMKFGVVGWTRSLAGRLAAENIRANVICPGGVDTPMLRTFLARPDSSKINIPMDDLLADRANRAPMKRTCTPDEIANAALFLTSDEASYISGAALPVDGAMTA